MTEQTQRGDTTYPEGRILSPEEFEEALRRKKKGRGGRRPLYPWDSYCDGHARLLVHGRHFHCQIESFARLFWRQCRRRRLQARWEADHDLGTILIWAETLDGRPLAPDPDEGDLDLLYDEGYLDDSPDEPDDGVEVDWSGEPTTVDEALDTIASWAARRNRGPAIE